MKISHKADNFLFSLYIFRLYSFMFALQKKKQYAEKESSRKASEPFFFFFWMNASDGRREMEIFIIHTHAH